MRQIYTQKELLIKKQFDTFDNEEKWELYNRLRQRDILSPVLMLLSLAAGILISVAICKSLI